eukprot:1289116-Rhodomonas_salina.2
MNGLGLSSRMALPPFSYFESPRSFGGSCYRDMAFRLRCLLINMFAVMTVGGVVPRGVVRLFILETSVSEDSSRTKKPRASYDPPSLV